MHGKFFGNQNAEQVLKHLQNLLDKNVFYNVSVDPLGIHYTIRESIRPPRPKTDDAERVKLGKIRKRKKGRTVNLKGRTW